MRSFHKRFQDAQVFIRYSEPLPPEVAADIGDVACRSTMALVMDAKTGYTALAASVCDLRDQFSRRIGRDIATRRAKRGLGEAIAHAQDGAPAPTVRKMIQAALASNDVWYHLSDLIGENNAKWVAVSIQRGIRNVASA